MLRYFVVATVLVVGVFVAVAAYHEYRLHIVVRGGRATMPPHATSSAPPSEGRARGLRGAAPWALSALPECLVQTQEWKGALTFVREHLPRGAREVAPWTVLHYGDCAVFVSHDQALVHRGADWLSIPPVAHLYTFAVRSSGNEQGVALIRSSCGSTRCPAVLRLYQRSGHI